MPPDLRPRRVIASRTTHLSVGARKGKRSPCFREHSGRTRDIGFTDPDGRTCAHRARHDLGSDAPGRRCRPARRSPPLLAARPRWLAPREAAGSRWSAIGVGVVALTVLLDRVGAPTPPVFAGFAGGIVFALLARWQLDLPRPATVHSQAVIGVTVGGCLQSSMLAGGRLERRGPPPRVRRDARAQRALGARAVAIDAGRPGDLVVPDDRGRRRGDHLDPPRARCRRAARGCAARGLSSGSDPSPL